MWQPSNETGMSMKYRILISKICIILTAIFLTSGCGEDEFIKEMRAENPFIKPKQPEKNTQSVMVTCNSIKLVIPESYSIDKLDIFKQYPAEKVLKGRQSPAVSGLTIDQVKNWEKNGFRIAIAPVSYWVKTIKSVKRFMADEAESSILNIYSSPSDFSEIYLENSASEKKLTLYDISGAESSYSVLRGNFTFRMQSTIFGLEQLKSNTVNFFLISAFKDLIPQSSLAIMAGKQQDQITGLMPLTLRGTLQNGYMIAISCSEGSITDGSIASDMLYNKETRNVSIVLLAPEAKLINSLAEMND